MALPKNRSNSVRRIYKRTPKGGHTIHYKRREKGYCHSCGITGSRLQAVDSSQGTNRSARRPNRKFGGQLSSAASSRIIKLAARVKEGAMQLEEVDVSILPYVKRYLAGKK